MRMHFSVIIAILASASVTDAHSATRKELTERYGVDPDTAIVPGQLARVIAAHDADARLKKFDVDNSGDWNSAEAEAARRDDVSKYTVGAPKKSPTSPEQIFVEGARSEQDRTGVPVDFLVTSLSPPPASMCDDDKQLFVRRDKLDNYMFNLTPVSKAQGASVAYTRDWQNDIDKFTIDANVSYAWREPCRDRPKGSSGAYISSYAIAPWVGAHGTRTNGSGDRSDLRFGVEGQVEVFDAVFNTQYFAVSPYYQTDFWGEAQVQGVQASWTPYWLEARLGGNYRRFSDYFDWYWQFSAEADYLNVDRVGRTGLADNDYGWLGFTAKLHVFPFSGVFWQDSALLDRVTLTGTAKYHWDAISRRDITLFSAELAYNLDPTGATSISILYENGTRKENLTEVEQLLLRLNYKY